MKASTSQWVESAKREANAFLTFYQSSRLTFRLTSLVISAGFLLSFIPPLYDVLILTPNNVFAFHLWRLFTYQLVEPNVILFVWSILSLYQLYKYIEPGWGTLEVLKYVGVLQLLSTLILSVLAFLAFAVFQSVEIFYHSDICGVQVGCIGALVALKQYLPDTVVFTTPYGRLKNGHLPTSSLLVAVVLWAVGLMRGTAPLLILLGLQLSWTYLRYFQALPGTEHPGDQNEHFTWASFFPRRVQPISVAVGKATFRFLERMKICQRRLHHHNLDDVPYAMMEGLESVETVMPESRDAERRRQRALRVLNERLTAVVGSGGGGGAEGLGVKPGSTTLASSSSSPSISTQVAGEAVSVVTNEAAGEKSAHA